jgi:methylated-DNA-[protein]-cysteine S-methyltransferase
MIHACTYTTPVGPMTVLAEQRTADATPPGPVVVASGFCSAAELLKRLPNGPDTEMVDVADLGPLEQPIQEYLAGDLAALDRIPLDQQGTDLQHQVWDGLRAIPAGETWTYGQLAATTRNPKAARAVGTACGKNLIAPFVPCHRAVRSDGSLGGYVYGLDVKRWLLSHEAAQVKQTA